MSGKSNPKLCAGCGHLFDSKEMCDECCVDCYRKELTERHQAKVGQREVIDSALNEYQTRAKTIVREVLFIAEWRTGAGPKSEAQRVFDAAREFLNE